MMMRALLLKTIYDKRWFILGWTLGMGVMAWLTIQFFPALKQGDILSDLNKELPQNLEALKGIIGDQDAFSTIGGYIAYQVYDIRLSLFMMISGLILALSLGAADEERGRMRTLLASPLSRGRVLLEQWAASQIILGITVIGTFLGSMLGITLVDESIPWKLLAQLGFMSMLLTMTGFTMTYAIAIGFGKRGVATFVGVFIAATSFILSTFGPMVDWLKDWEPVSLLYYFGAKEIFKEGINWLHVGILIGLTILFYLAAWLGFRNRDVSGS